MGVACRTPEKFAYKKCATELDASLCVLIACIRKLVKCEKLICRQNLAEIITRYYFLAIFIILINFNLKKKKSYLEFREIYFLVYYYYS